MSSIDGSGAAPGAGDGPDGGVAGVMCSVLPRPATLAPGLIRCKVAGTDPQIVNGVVVRLLVIQRDRQPQVRDRGHPGAALRAGDCHPVHDSFSHTGTPRNRSGNLCRLHVLALPAEGITNTIDKIEVAALIFTH